MKNTREDNQTESAIPEENTDQIVQNVQEETPEPFFVTESEIEEAQAGEGKPDNPGELGEPVEPAGNHETKFGALDDEEDPRGDSMAGSDQGIGASVEFNKSGQGENTDAAIGTEVSAGIDVSKYQGTIDWSQVKDSGVEFAMIRVGYRTKVTDVIFSAAT